MKTISRRAFLRNAGLVSASLPWVGLPLFGRESGGGSDALDVHIFSKHLQFLDYRKMGEISEALGFSGVDLTVRPNGHVAPESVTTDLPKAVKEIREGGSNCQIITTNVESVHNPLDREIIKTAAEQGIKYYRSNWYKYPEDVSMIDALEMYKQEIKELSRLNKELGIVGCYQNIKGTVVGSSFWEVKQILELADPVYFGSEYDIRHASFEGSSSWENGLRLLHPHIKVIVLKDYSWGKVNGKWEPINTPLGEGIVDFTRFFKLLKTYNLKPPATLHLEYPIGGAEHGSREISVDEQYVYDAMKKDLNTIHKLWKYA